MFSLVLVNLSELVVKLVLLSLFLGDNVFFPVLTFDLDIMVCSAGYCMVCRVVS